MHFDSVEDKAEWLVMMALGLCALDHVFVDREERQRMVQRTIRELRAEDGPKLPIREGVGSLSNLARRFDMPVDVISGSVSVSIIADQTTLSVGDLAPGTMFRLFTTDQGRGAWNAAGRVFVKAGSGHGGNGKLLKNRYNGDVAPMAIALPMSADDSRAFTPATQRLTADSPVARTLGILKINV